MTPCKRMLLLAEIPQTRIARQLGVSCALINQIVNGTREPYPKIRRDIACASGISEELLFPDNGG